MENFFRSFQGGDFVFYTTIARVTALFLPGEMEGWVCWAHHTQLLVFEGVVVDRLGGREQRSVSMWIGLKWGWIRRHA